MKKMYILLRKHWIATTILAVSLATFLWSTYWFNKTISPTLTPVVEEKELSPSTQKIPQHDNNIIENKKITTTTTRQTTTSTEKSTATQIPIRIKINNVIYPLTISENASVYDAMQQLQANKQITVEFKNYSGLGYFVNTINGIQSDTLSGTHWIYYINGIKAQIGISQYTLKSNDIITWKYESQE